MAEFLRIDPADLVEEVVEEHCHSASSDFRSALFVVFAAAVFWLASGSGQIHDVDGLRGLAFFIAIALLIAGGVWFWTDIVEKLEAGSRINLIERKFYWWDGRAPAQIHVIDIDSLKRVDIESRGEGDEFIVLCDISNSSREVPGYCFKNARQWARTLKAHFPHVAIG